MKNIPSIAIIGGGNMGGCLAKGLIANHYPEHTLWISNPSLDKLKTLQEMINVNFNMTNSNIEAAHHADILIFAVKPLILSSVLQELQSVIQEKNPLLISTVTGITTSSIQQLTHPHAAIVRAMPNTPAMIGCGATGLFANTKVSFEQKQMVESIFRALGLAVWLEHENLINAVTALSGSGPAYFFYVIELMQKTGVAMGLPEDLSQILTLQTAYGAARMALESQRGAKELREQVTSKGGTTEQAIKVFEDMQLDKIITEALEAARVRAEELSEKNSFPPRSAGEG